MSKIYKLRAWLKSQLLTKYSNIMTIVAILIVIVTSTGFTLFSHYFAKIQISSTLDTIASNSIGDYRNTIGNYHDFMESVVSDINFDCGISDKKVLEKKAYNNYNIKKIDVETNKKNKCSSFSDSNFVEPQYDTV
ncbi:hypothetical protein CTM85_20565, partial [Photobacterium phosphoreum]